jgi:hypothetical protein
MTPLPSPSDPPMRWTTRWSWLSHGSTTGPLRCRLKHTGLVKVPRSTEFWFKLDIRVALALLVCLFGPPNLRALVLYDVCSAEEQQTDRQTELHLEIYDQLIYISRSMINLQRCLSAQELEREKQPRFTTIAIRSQPRARGYKSWSRSARKENYSNINKI